MRRLNAILSMGVLALFIFHAVYGGFQLAGVLPGGNLVMKVLSWVMVVMMGLHALIGIKLTADTLRISKKAGASYYKENRLFWVRRISGLAIMVFVAFHLMIFMSGGDPVRLHLFSHAELVTQILLAVSVGLHVISNIRPLMISFGIRSFRIFMLDIILILSALMAFTGAGFIIYFLRWNLF